MNCQSALCYRESGLAQKGGYRRRFKRSFGCLQNMVFMDLKEQGFSQADAGGTWHSEEKICCSTMMEIKYPWLPPETQASSFYSKPPSKLHCCILKVEFCTELCQIMLKSFPLTLSWMASSVMACFQHPWGKNGNGKFSFAKNNSWCCSFCWLLLNHAYCCSTYHKEKMK